MPEARIITAAEAIREALDLALGQRSDTYLIGEGVTDPGGIFGTTKGLVDDYGPRAGDRNARRRRTASPASPSGRR